MSSAEVPETVMVETTIMIKTTSFKPPAKSIMIKSIKVAEPAVSNEELRMPIVVVIPRSGPNKDTVREPFRAPVPVGCARIGRVRIESILADRRRANLDAERNLCLGIRCWKRQRRQKNKIFQITHNATSQQIRESKISSSNGFEKLFRLPT